jgi:hypothetical protein
LVLTWLVVVTSAVEDMAVDIALNTLAVVTFADGVTVKIELVVLGMIDGVVVVSFFSGIFVSIPTLKMISNVAFSGVDTISSSSVLARASKVIADGLPTVAFIVSTLTFSRMFCSIAFRVFEGVFAIEGI